MPTAQRVVLAVSFAMLCTATVRAAENEPDERLLYKTVGDVKLHLHVFRPAKPSDQPQPCIVFFFGGGWVGGSPTQFYPHCRHLAERGMVAISAEYRVKNRHGTTPFACVEDGKSAVRWVRRNAAKLNIDPKRIAAGGGSAGGHVAAATGTLAGFDAKDEDRDVSSRPNALVLFNPVFDNGPDGYGHERVKERWREFSPLHNIDRETPPTIVFLGTKDKLIPVKTAKRYGKKMSEAAVRYGLHLYEDQPHGFFNYRGGRNQYYDRTVREMDRFLESLGYLEGKPAEAERGAGNRSRSRAPGGNPTRRRARLSKPGTSRSAGIPQRSSGAEDLASRLRPDFAVRVSARSVRGANRRLYPCSSASRVEDHALRVGVEFVGRSRQRAVGESFGKVFRGCRRYHVAQVGLWPGAGVAVESLYLQIDLGPLHVAGGRIGRGGAAEDPRNGQGGNDSDNHHRGKQLDQREAGFRMGSLHERHV